MVNGELHQFNPNDRYPYETIRKAYELLIAKSAELKGRLGYYPMPAALIRYREEKQLYDEAPFRVYLDEDLFGDIDYLPLNPGESFGRLRIMELDEYPRPREIVLYRSLPNEMPRSAGIITEVRQTPLSHVNLRAQGRSRMPYRGGDPTGGNSLAGRRIRLLQGGC